MSWALVRLDDRLLHGQVAVGWAGKLHPRRIVVADDRLAASTWEREMVESAAPDGVEVRIVPVDGVAGLPPGDTEDAFLLLRGPLELARLLRAGARLPEVNVGGLHTAAGKHRVLDYFYADAADAAALREAAATGCRLFAQDVPGNPVEDVLALLGRAGL